MKLNEGTRNIIWEIGQFINKEKYPTISDIRKKVNKTLSYSSEEIRKLEKINLIKRTNGGRNKYINFTSDGWKAYHSLRILNEVGLE